MRKEPIKIGDLLKKYNLLVLLIVFVIISSILSPNFLTLGNLLNLLQQASIPGIVAIGMTLVIILGGIDLFCRICSGICRDDIIYSRE